jgi:AcrR family transcriptional regulator
MVCRKAGVNPGMFIYYFKTKDQFIERLLSDVYEEFFQKFSLEVRQGGNDLERMKQALFLVAGVLALVSGTVFYITLRIRHALTWWSLGGAGSVYFAYLVYVFLLSG